MKVRLLKKEFSPALLQRLPFFAIASFAAGLFLKLTWELKTENELLRFDERFLIYISKLRTPSWNGPMVDITALGSATLVTLFAVTGLILLLLVRDRRGAFFFMTSIAGGAIFNSLLKLAVRRERPSVVPPLVEVTQYSYPSGHTAMSTVMFLTLAFLVSRYFKKTWERTIIFSIAAFVIFIVGASRMYLGVHYPTDVISGVLFGGAWTCALCAFYFSHSTVKNS